MERDYRHDILPEIQKRYAVKYFENAPVPREDLMSMLEAARYAPSCYNEQPWRYILGDEATRHAKLAECLMPGNAWAKEAPVLLLVLSTKTFKLNNKPNAYNRFDAGCATGFLQLEAVRRGYAVHCMAGFSADKACEAFQVPDSLDIIAMVALGKPVQHLTDEQHEDQEPGTRNPLESLIWGE